MQGSMAGQRARAAELFKSEDRSIRCQSANYNDFEALKWQVQGSLRCAFYGLIRARPQVTPAC